MQLDFLKTALEKAGKPHYSKNDILRIVSRELNSLKNELQTGISSSTGKKGTSQLKSGDIIFLPHGKPRPYLVISIKKQHAVCVGISSTRDDLYLCDLDSRQTRFTDNYIAKSLIVVPEQAAKHNFIAIYDNRSHFKTIKKLVAEQIKHLV